MMHFVSRWGVLVVQVSLVCGFARGQGSPEVLQSAARPLPKLAVVTAVRESTELGTKNVEDLLMIELGNQSFVQLVDRQALQAVMREHAIALTSQTDAQSAATLGRFAGADYLLHVLVAEDKATVGMEASLRLVEVATGQVKVDAQVALSENLALSLAAVREKILAAVRPESQASNRLTVGIAAFPNRSGTARSDTLGIELQKALRALLSQQAWAVVLEREYPKVLLDELDLARAGLVRDKVVEALPPADFVVSGSLDDVDRKYEPGKPWDVKLDLTLRLRGHMKQIRHTFRSDAIKGAANEIMGRIDDFRRQPTAAAAVPEKELWRRQAMYLMPARCETWAQAIVPNFGFSNQWNRMETIRAWQNVLMLDGDDTEAMTYLGVCLIGFNRWSRTKAAAAGCIEGSRLLERAWRQDPSPMLADTFIASIGAMKEAAPARAREMAQFVVDHRDRFTHGDCYWVKSVLVAPVPKAGSGSDATMASWECAVQNAEKDPDSVLLAFGKGRGQIGLSEQGFALLTEYLDSPVPVVQFVAHKTLGGLLCQEKKDPAGLEHFDKAIALLERASEGTHYSTILNDVYQRRIEACEHMGRPEEARQTALAGVRRFLATGQFDMAIAWLDHYCVTKVLGAGEEKEALAVCDAYLAAAAKKDYVDRHYWPGIAARREEILTSLSGKRVPGLGDLRLLTGTEMTQTSKAYPMRKYMAATDGKLWLAGGNLGLSHSALMYDHVQDKASPLLEIPYRVNSVAATTDCVFFGTDAGLYEFDTKGTLLKHYNEVDGMLPGDRITDVCEGGGRIYFGFHGSPSGGVAVLDPASDTVSVLAPSSRDVKRQDEPRRVFRLRWDAVTPRLYAYSNPYPFYEYPDVYCKFSWTPEKKGWESYGRKGGPWLTASQGDDSVLVRVEEGNSVFAFLKTGQQVAALVPVPSTMGEPAWDETRIWVPTASGLYEVDRATGKVDWVAYEAGTPFYSLLKAHGRLYVATARGLYCCGSL